MEESTQINYSFTPDYKKSLSTYRKQVYNKLCTVSAYQVQVAPNILIAMDTLGDPKLCEHVTKMAVVVVEYLLDC